MYLRYMYLHGHRQIVGCNVLLELFQSSHKGVHLRTYVQGGKFQVEIASVGILHVGGRAGICYVYRGIAGGD